MTIKCNNLRVLVLAGLLWLPLLAWPATDQYYLVGYQAPEGSISSGGQSKQLVYLRWDPVEGSLPSDVVAIRLTRDGTVLLDKAVGEVMSPAEINALYSGPAQERRLLEIVLKLKQEAVADGGDFQSSDFASRIWARINPLLIGSYESGWAHLASRGDINVAIARYRAFVDDPGAGSFDYELLAIDANDTSARLGFVTVNTTQSQSSLGATDFVQVATSQCDLPESAKDHYTVALSWDEQKAANLTDQFASAIYSGGYDLYRTTTNLDDSVIDPPLRDIAQEAANSAHDSRGVVVLTGLEMVNDVLLTVPADSGAEAEWIETYSDLTLAGLKPGDRRAYYLVPRDFTGNYGPTVATIVVVPNLLRPATPWDLRPVVDMVSPGLFGPNSGIPSLTVSWDHINLDNYVATYGRGRTFCNLGEAAASGVLEFVGRGENCRDDTIRRVRVDVTDYLVYRFPDFESASRFKDSDGDGVADRDERATLQQCDAAVQPPGAINYLLSPLQANMSEIVLPISGRRTVQIQDITPASPQVQGNTFWYRVVARTPDGMLSYLSAPQRGLVPDRTLPPRPVIEVTRAGSVRDACELQIDSGTGSWSLLDQVDEVSYTVSCAGVDGPITLYFNDKAALASSNKCATVRNNCNLASGADLVLSYPDIQNGGELCRVELPTDLTPENNAFLFCASGQARLVPTYVAGDVPLQFGEVIAQPLQVSATVDIGASPDVCIDLFENIGGDHARVATSCDTATPGVINYEVEFGFFCGYAVTRDGNNNVSAAAVAPCTTIAPNTGKVPTTPQPVSLTANTNSADFSWRVPVEPIAVTLVSLDHRRGDGSSDREFISVAVAAAGSGAISNYTASIAPLAGDSDEICVRYQSVGQTAVNGATVSSGWSAPQCVMRYANSSDVPLYLPWPIVTAAVEGTPLDVGLQGYTLPPLPEPPPEPLPESPGFFLYVDLGPIPDEKVLEVDCQQIFTLIFGSAVCNQRGSQKIRSLVRAHSPFLAYRQSRDASGVPGDWVQVSPLIEFAHFDTVAADPNGPLDRTRQLNDPYIKIRATPLQNVKHRLAFEDRYPYSFKGGDFRYQFVYFDETHRITRWRQSDWITVPVLFE